MAFWDAGRTLRTLISCVCSRTRAVKGDAVVWEPVNYRAIPRTYPFWKKFAPGPVLPAPPCFLRVGGVCCSSRLGLYHRVVLRRPLAQDLVRLAWSKCLKNNENGGGRMAKTCPGWKSSTWMFWFGKRQQRKGVGECEESVTKPAPTRIFHPIVIKVL